LESGNVWTARIISLPESTWAYGGRHANSPLFPLGQLDMNLMNAFLSIVSGFVDAYEYIVSDPVTLAWAIGVGYGFGMVITGRMLYRWCERVRHTDTWMVFAEILTFLGTVFWPAAIATRTLWFFITAGNQIKK
jgi:hypothetical protein